jgi:hypothetical protein
MGGLIFLRESSHPSNRATLMAEEKNLPESLRRQGRIFHIVWTESQMQLCTYSVNVRDFPNNVPISSRNPNSLMSETETLQQQGTQLKSYVC